MDNVGSKALWLTVMRHRNRINFQMQSRTQTLVYLVWGPIRLPAMILVHGSVNFQYIYKVGVILHDLRIKCMLQQNCFPVLLRETVLPCLPQSLPILISFMVNKPQIIAWWRWKYNFVLHGIVSYSPFK